MSTIFRFSGRKSCSQQKPTKTITHFTMQFRLKQLTHFANLNSINNIKLYSHNTPKTMFLLPPEKKNSVGVLVLVCWCWCWCQKTNLHCTISRRPRNSFSKQLQSSFPYIPANLRLKNFVPET